MRKNTLLPPLLFIFVILIPAPSSANETLVAPNGLGIKSKKCDIFKGRWVYDRHSSPAYNSTSCPFIRTQFDCLRNGRSDTTYLKYRWQPDGCHLSRFDTREFVRRFRGKKVMFVGDSLMLNQWQSLTCLIHSAIPRAKYTLNQHPPVYEFNLPRYGISIRMQWHQFLVEIVDEKKGKVLKLDYINGDKWRGVDVLVFDSYHWWFYTKPEQPWDYMEVRGKLYTRLDRTVAFKIALESWKRWIDQNVDHSKSRVFYQGISPSHYRGSDWGQPRAKGCAASRRPIQGEGGSLRESPAVEIVKSIISTMRHPAYFLDISQMSLLRPDAHPNVYVSPARRGHGADCTHWCLPGLPDTWNQLLYNVLV